MRDILPASRTKLTKCKLKLVTRELLKVSLAKNGHMKTKAKSRQEHHGTTERNTTEQKTNTREETRKTTARPSQPRQQSETPPSDPPVQNNFSTEETRGRYVRCAGHVRTVRKVSKWLCSASSQSSSKSEQSRQPMDVPVGSLTQRLARKKERSEAERRVKPHVIQTSGINILRNIWLP